MLKRKEIPKEIPEPDVFEFSDAGLKAHDLRALVKEKSNGWSQYRELSLQDNCLGCDGASIFAAEILPNCSAILDNINLTNCDIGANGILIIIRAILDNDELKDVRVQLDGAAVQGAGGSLNEEQRALLIVRGITISPPLRRTLGNKRFRCHDQSEGVFYQYNLRSSGPLPGEVTNGLHQEEERAGSDTEYNSDSDAASLEDIRHPMQTPSA